MIKGKILLRIKIQKKIRFNYLLTKKKNNYKRKNIIRINNQEKKN